MQLSNPYTYEIIEASRETKAARQALGQAASEIVDNLATKFYESGAELYMEGVNLLSQSRTSEVQTEVNAKG